MIEISGFGILVCTLLWWIMAPDPNVKSLKQLEREHPEWAGHWIGRHMTVPEIRRYWSDIARGYFLWFAVGFGMLFVLAKSRT